MVTRGWADPQNYKSLTGDGDYLSMTRGEPLKPGQFYTMTFPLQADDQVILPGQQLAIMILSSDAGFTLRPAPGAELTLDLDGTSFTLPVVGGKSRLQSALGARSGHPIQNANRLGSAVCVGSRVVSAHYQLAPSAFPRHRAKTTAGDNHVQSSE